MPTVTQPAVSQEILGEQAPQQSFEERVGVHWFQWIGIAALVAALIFFLKWAFDNGWIGPVGRTVFGYVLAGGAMAAGDKLRSKYGVWSLAFTGGGALAAYIVTWIAFHRYHLFPSVAALSMYSLTTLVTCLLAGYYRAIPLAAFGIVGGFLTPLLTGEGGSITGLLTYILIIDLGVLALGHVRQWRTLNTLAFLGTVFWELYALEHGGIARTYALLFLTSFGAIYLLIPAMYNILRRLKSEPGDLLILIGNGLVHFWLLLQWLGKTPGLRERIDAPITLGFSALFLAVGAGVYQKNKNDTPLVLGSLSLTVLFATIAIPLQLGEVWTTLAWSLEAAFLLWMALELHDKRIQYFAWPVMGVAYLWYLFHPSGNSIILYQQSGLLLFFFFALLLVAIASVALSRDDRSEYYLFTFVWIGVVVLVFGYCLNTLALFSRSSLSTFTYRDRLFEITAIVGGSYLVLWQAKTKWTSLKASEKMGFKTLGIGVQIITLMFLTHEYTRAIGDKILFRSFQNPWQIKQMGVSLIWALYAGTTLIIGFMKGWRPLRLFSIILLLIAVGKLTVVDLFSLGTGYRVVGFTVLGALLVGVSFLYQQNKEQLKEFFVATEPDSSSTSS